MQPTTELQKEYVLRTEKFLTKFKEKSKEFKIPEDMIPKAMRLWLDKALVKIPYVNLFPQTHINQELETYKELCTLPIEKMEWGVIQKAVSIIIGLSPDSFVDEELRGVYTCLHTTKDSLRFCIRCEGKGVISPNAIPKNEKLTLLVSTEVIYRCNLIKNFIFTEIENMKNSSIEEVWQGYTQSERFNINGEIAKKHGKQPSIIQ
jgi:hypothetical protein